MSKTTSKVLKQVAEQYVWYCAITLSRNMWGNSVGF